MSRRHLRIPSEVQAAIGRAWALADTRDLHMPEDWCKGYRDGAAAFAEYLVAELRALGVPSGEDGALEDAVSAAYIQYMAERAARAVQS